MQTEHVAMFLMLAGVIVQTLTILVQAVHLRDWKRRAIIAETECKHMAAIYGPPKR